MQYVFSNLPRLRDLSLVFTVCLLSLGLIARQASADMIVDSPWETGQLERYFGESVSATERPVVVTGGPVCEGQRALSFPLTFRADGTGFRNELTFKGPPMHFPLGEDVWFGFAIYLPEDWQPDQHSDILFQLHDWPDQNEGWRSPPVALSATRDHWLLWILFDTKPNSGNPPVIEGRTTFNMGAFQTGRWTSWVIRLRLSPFSDGIVEVWKDGEQVVDHTGGNTFNDERGPYLKIGNYKPSWRDVNTWGGPSAFPARNHFLDALRIGDASSTRADVEPKCGPRPPVLW